MRQVTAHARPLQIAGLVLAGLGLVPGFPTALFLGLGATLAAGGFLMGRRHRSQAVAAFQATAQQAGSVPEAALIEVRVGQAFLGRAGAVGAELEGLRAALEGELGVAVPRLRLAIDPALAPSQVRLLVDGIPRVLEDQADAAGVAGQVHRGVLGCAAQLVGIQETQALVSRMEAHYGDLVREVGKAVPLPRIAEVVRRLVEEQVSVANMRSVLEALAEWGPREQAPGKLADHVRASLGRQICHRWADGAKCLAVLLVEGGVDEALRAAMKANVADGHLGLEAATAEAIIAGVRRQAGPRQGADRAAAAPVVVAAFDTRRHLRTLLVRHGVDVPVLSHAELVPEFSASIVGTIALPAAEAVEPTAGEARQLRAVPSLAA